MKVEPIKTCNKKGVIYTKANNEIVDCLFCRIVRAQSPPNQLWYQDDQCAVFVPKRPVGRLHFLIVPLQHIQNVATLTEEHRPLLEHMKKVAQEQLRVHAQHIGSTEHPLLSLALPPSHYGFNRGHLPELCHSSEVYKDEPTAADPSFVYCFHRPPYNSIDHLHLHAIQKSYQSSGNQFKPIEFSPWYVSLEDILRNLRSSKVK